MLQTEPDAPVLAPLKQDHVVSVMNFWPKERPTHVECPPGELKVMTSIEPLDVLLDGLVNDQHAPGIRADLQDTMVGELRKDEIMLGVMIGDWVYAFVSLRQLGLGLSDVVV